MSVKKQQWTRVKIAERKGETMRELRSIFCGDPESAKATFRAVTLLKPKSVPPA